VPGAYLLTMELLPFVQLSGLCVSLNNLGYGGRIPKHEPAQFFHTGGV
jgi:hypothetical protein